MANDDGEPRHSAGTPILGQILSRELYGTAVVVVRYFGGTKLGLPGLIHAYKTAASMALELANTKTIEVGDYMEIAFPYAATAAVDRLLHSYHLEPSHSAFEGVVKHTVWVPRRLRDIVRASILEYPDIQFTPLPSLK
jgi:putative IMPACT (imprinted ancient) family translation regulator